MSPDSAHPIELDDLLAERAWLSAMARRLVRDANLAQDLEQETWTAALTSPPPERTSPRGWLARVLRRRLADTRRSDARRTAREAAAIPPRSVDAPEDLVARAQRNTDLLEAVLELPESYRLVVLARYFEGLSVREIAERLDVPDSTVRTRCARALERLRVALDSRYGTRDAWIAALGAADRPAPTSSLSSLSLAGGLALTAKTQMIAAAALVAVGVAAGWFAGRGTAAEAPGEAVPPVTTDDPSSWPAAAVEAVRVRDRRIARLEQRLGARPADVTEVDTPAAAAAGAPVAEDSTPARGLSRPIEVDEHPGLLEGIDWVAFARHSVELMQTLARVSESLSKDGTVPPGAEQDVRRNDEPIAGILRPVAEKLPGIGPKSAANHPAFLGNAIAAVLEHGNKPLTDDQRAGLERLMRGFEARDHHRLQGYDEAAPALRKVLDEGALRQEFADAAFRLLTADQQALVRPPQVRGRVRLDMLATGLFWADHVEPVRLADAQAMEDAVAARVVALLQAPGDAYDGITTTVRTWLAEHPEAATLASTDHLDRLGMFRIDRVTRLAAQQLDLWSQLERDVDLPQASRDRLRAASRVLVPVASRR